MQVLALNGSPHEEGNTAFLLKKSLRAAKEEGAKTKLLHVKKALAELDTPFCTHCSSPCNQSCYQGTLVEEYFDLLTKADGIILGSPVYFGTVSAQLKSFWDLGRALRAKRSLFNTPGGAVTVGGSRFGGQETTIRALQDMMLIQGMIIVGDGAEKEAGYQERKVGHQGACAQAEAENDKIGQTEAARIGLRIVEVAEKMAENK